MMMIIRVAPRQLRDHGAHARYYRSIPLNIPFDRLQIIILIVWRGLPIQEITKKSLVMVKFDDHQNDFHGIETLCRRKRNVVTLATLVCRMPLV